MTEGWDPVKENQRNWCWVGEKGNWGRHHCLIDFDFGTILKVRRGSLKSSWIIGAWWQFTGSAIRSRRLIRILLIAWIFRRLRHSDKKLKNKIICVSFKNLKCYITRIELGVGVRVMSHSNLLKGRKESCHLLLPFTPLRLNADVEMDERIILSNP